MMETKVELSASGEARKRYGLMIILISTNSQQDVKQKGETRYHDHVDKHELLAGHEARKRDTAS